MVIVIVSVCVSLLMFILLFNSLVKKRNYVKQALAGVDVQLKMRFDLVPNLVDTVKVHMEHEKSLLEDLTKLRVSALSGAHSTQDKAQLDQKMTAMLKSIMVSVENYPNLKTDSSFKQLQFSLHDIESQLSAARRNFNSMVIDYNNSIEVFPNNLVAPVLGFRSESVFSAPDAEKANPSIGQLLKKSS